VPRSIEINDTSDPRIQCYANLRSGSGPDSEADWFIVEGRWCVQRLIESPHAVISLLVQSGRERETESWLAQQTPLYSLPSDQIRRLVGFDFHRGVLACGRRPNLLTIDDLEFRTGAPTIALAMLGVNERENLGSMMRTAAALGIKNLLIGPKTADPLSRRAIRVSMATVLKQQLYMLDQPTDQLTRLQQTRNVRTIVTTLDSGATPLNKFEPDDREMILVVGNEADGVDPATQQIATDRVTIPMQLGTDSLNVSVAAAIFMYQLLNRHREGA
jgi:tRNA G18 (ribose-2'-O)-methylase SpoU